MVNEPDLPEVTTPEPLDEVLQRMSEQTLQLNHVEAGLKEVATSVSDVGEATQAGLLEVRNLIAQMAQIAQSRPAAGGAGTPAEGTQQSIIERLDELEATAASSGRKQTLMVAALAVQIVALAFMLAVSTGTINLQKKSEQFAFAPPAPQAVTSSPPAANANAPAVAPVLPLTPADPAKEAGDHAGKAKRRTKH
jgi:hypothetical protein